MGTVQVLWPNGNLQCYGWPAAALGLPADWTAAVPGGTGNLPVAQGAFEVPVPARDFALVVLR